MWNLLIFIKLFCKWFLILILVYPLIVFVSAPYFPKKIKQARGANGHMWSRLREADSAKQTDLLVVGSSIAYRGIDPRAFDSLGLKLFNLGSSAQTPLQSAYLIEQYFDNFKPSVVLWDVNFNTFQSSGLESFTDICSNKKVDKDLAKEIFDIRDWDAVNTLLYVSLRQNLTSYFNFNEPLRKKDDTYIPGGFVEKDMHVNESFSKPVPQSLAFRPYQTKSFERALQYLNAKGVQVVLVFAPVTEPAYTAYLNRAEINQYFISLTKKYGVKSFLNYNESRLTGLQEHDHFYDEYHLNQDGVKVYNQALLRDLREIGVLNFPKTSVN